MLLAAEPGTLSILVVVGLIILVWRPANRGTRALVIGLAVIIGVGIVALTSYRSHQVQQSARESNWSWQAQEMARQNRQRAESFARDAQARSEALARDAQQRSDAIARSAATRFTTPPRVQHSNGRLTAEVKAPAATQSGTAPLSVATKKSSLFAALSDAVVHAWTSSGTTPPTAIAKQPENLLNHGPPLPANPNRTRYADLVKTPDQPPAWVNTTGQQQGDAYLMTVHVGPYTTLLECERELPKALQAAVAEYAELLLGDAHVHLPDDNLQPSLERQRWVETRPIDIAGAAQAMVVLHVQLGFDPAMQRQIRYLAEHAAQSATIYRRLKVTGLALGGLLGLLALAWGGLSLVGTQSQTKEENLTRETAPVAARKGPRFRHIFFGGLLAVLVILVILAVFWGVRVPAAFTPLP